MHSFGTLLRFIWRSSKRATVFVVGLALVAVGLIMFVTPGPGIVLVVAGLAVLATEFAWAEHLLDKAREQALKAGASAQRVPGVSAVTSAAGRLVPRRWRRVTASRVTVTTVDGVVSTERTTVTATEITVVAPGDLPGEARPTVGAAADPRRTAEAPADSGSG